MVVCPWPGVTPTLPGKNYIPVTFLRVQTRKVNNKSFRAKNNVQTRSFYREVITCTCNVFNKTLGSPLIQKPAEHQGKQNEKKGPTWNQNHPPTYYPTGSLGAFPFFNCMKITSRRSQPDKSSTTTMWDQRNRIKYRNLCHASLRHSIIQNQDSCRQKRLCLKEPTITMKTRQITT